MFFATILLSQYSLFIIVLKKDTQNKNINIFLVTITPAINFICLLYILKTKERKGRGGVTAEIVQPQTMRYINI